MTFPTSPADNLLIIPGSPALIAELATGDPAADNLRTTVHEALTQTMRQRPTAPIDLIGSQAPRWYTKWSGNLRAWGVDLEVGGGNYLPELVQRYLLGPYAAQVRRVRAGLDELDPTALTLLALDGSAGLGPAAPLAEVPGALQSDAWCQSLLAQPQRAGTPQLAGIVEPELWQSLAALRPRRSKLLAADSSTGVGRYVAVWEVA